MDPSCGKVSKRRRWLPRTRGDGPRVGVTDAELPPASPHTRGWTQQPGWNPRSVKGFPAHAGMDPWVALEVPTASRLPRTRGDGPADEAVAIATAAASPHTRGWTGMTIPADARERGFPAHAGMDPDGGQPDAACWRLPRTRGDGPGTPIQPRLSSVASPHTRGWPRACRGHRPHGPGFPAHAGMDPQQIDAASVSIRLPRTRGDGPETPADTIKAALASPHTRGWTVVAGLHERRERGFPAHAGMDPDGGQPDAACWRLPRTRGDGPVTVDDRAHVWRASPHTRGWTVADRPHEPADRGFPAHAGMDPARQGHPRTRSWLPLEMATRKGPLWPREMGPPFLGCGGHRDVAGRSGATGGHVAMSAIAVAPPVARGTPGCVWRS